ncbi:hypothetical protein FHR32_002189 [Streptosporangium album]|uniref:Uncharacterized protein n=1 Tax=Streptosporangium album TaxID=47479 RepID=A0A7W7RTF6_9ACTN|nr:hypothetical protein [Streptosporangium album]MBB4937884.1 hypothetical protein [Streptosporangium album]
MHDLRTGEENLLLMTDLLHLPKAEGKPAARCARAALSLQRIIAFARSVIALISANYLPECTSCG